MKDLVKVVTTIEHPISLRRQRWSSDITALDEVAVSAETKKKSKNIHSIRPDGHGSSMTLLTAISQQMR